MRLLLYAFVFGVMLLQQRPSLPGAFAWCAGAALFGGAALAFWTLRAFVEPYGNGAASRRAAALASLAAMGVLAGYGYAAWRAEMRLREVLPPALEGREMVLVGHIRGLPTPGARTRFVLAVDVDEARRQTGAAHFPRLVQLSWPRRSGSRAPPLMPGQRWQLTLRLKAPHSPANFEGFDGESALFARGVRAIGYVVAPAAARRLPGRAGGLSAAIDRWRFMLAARIEQVLATADHRGVVVALALGVQEAVTHADRTVLQRTGTSHLVAVSGLHIGLVAGIAAVVAAWLWRRSCLLGGCLARRGAREWPLRVPTPLVAALAGTLCAAVYAALSGFNVPAQRAFSMLCVATVAFTLGRNIAPSLMLAWSAGLVVLADPWAVLGPAFWLSFGAVAVISLAWHTRMRRAGADDSPDDVDLELDGEGGRPEAGAQRRTVGRRFARRALERAATVVTMATTRERVASAWRAQYAVTIGLAPLTAYWFSRISLVGPVANVLAVPAVSLFVTPLVLLAVVLPAPLDAASLECAHALLALTMRMLQRLADAPWAEWRLARPSAWAMASAAVGVAWALMPRGWPLRFGAPLAWLPLAWPVPDGPAHGAFRVTALDVGQGSAIVVETERHALLFDAGPGPESTRAGERIVAPYLRVHGIARLDAFVVSHGDADHAGGAAAVLAETSVRQLMGGLPAAHPLWRAAREQGADALRCVAGQRWQWDGVIFSVLWPEAGPLPAASNAQSCVLKVEAREATLLLTGDIDAAVERRLVARASKALRADVLIVAHHGSKTSSTELFLDSVQPRIAVFQVGYRNRFGHPHPAVWSRFAARGIELARTDRDGAVRVDAGVPVLERYRAMHRRYWMQGWENETKEAGREPLRPRARGGSRA